MPDEPLEDLGPAGEPDTRAKSVALPTDEGDQVVAQQNMGAEESAGSGEWPVPDADPTGPALGTTPEGAQAASRREQAPLQPPPPGTDSQPELRQDGSPGGDRGPARTADTAAGARGPHHPQESFKTALDSDSVAGGSQSTPDEAEGIEQNPERE